MEREAERKIERKIVPFSGGVDSLVALQWARENTYGEVTAIFCSLEHEYFENEKNPSFDIVSKMNDVEYAVANEVRLGKYEHDMTHIPYRNLYLILMAAQRIPEGESGTIVIQNVQVGEQSVGGRTKEFNEEAEELLNSIEDRDIEVISPFSHMTKSQLVQWLRKRVSDDFIRKTVSCSNSDEGHCGRCEACFRRWIAFENNGIETDFEEDITEWEGCEEYAQKMLRGEYERTRTLETMNVLREHDIVKDIVVVDLDGVLAEEQSPMAFDAEKAEPIWDNIGVVNKLYDDGYGVIIHTARPERNKYKTIEWLEEHDVDFHRLEMDKPRGDYYMDDRNIKDWEEMIKETE